MASQLEALTAALDAGPTWTWTVDRSICLERHNHHFQTMAGILVGRAIEIGEPLLRFLPRDDVARWKRWYVAAFQGTPGIYEVVIDVMAQPRAFTVEIQPELKGEMVVAATCIVREDTRDEAVVSQVAIENARREAETANRDKDHFLAVMSHEFRTPLHAIVGMSELLKKTELSTSQRELVDTLQSCARTLENMSNDILEFSRLDRAQLNPTPSKQHFEALVFNCVESLSVEASRKALDLSCMMEPGLPRDIVVDAKRWRQIATNLIGNAVKYTEDGRVDIHVRRHGSRGFELEVSDTGPGIAPEDRSKIFDRFYRARSARTQVGAGIGLSVVKALAQAIGGEIELAESSPAGSRFVFRWVDGSACAVDDIWGAVEPSWRAVVVGTRPALRGLVPYLRAWGADDVQTVAAPEVETFSWRARDVLIWDEGSPVPTSLVEEIVGAGGRVVVLTPFHHVSRSFDERVHTVRRPIRPSRFRAALVGVAEVAPARSAPTLSAPAHRPVVLLAEDNSANGRLFTAILEREAVDVIVAQNGVEAIEMFNARRVDLVLMDIDMPKLNGIDAAAEIRAQEHQRGGTPTPIVAVTAHVSEVARRQCLEAGMNHFVTKPIHRAGLQSILEEWVDRRPMLLFADDFAPARTMMAQAVIDDGRYRACTVGSGEDAVLELKRGGVAAAFLDFEMPGISGVEAARRIRLFDANVPLIGLTGAGERRRQEALAVGFSEVVVKPAPPTTLLDMLGSETPREQAAAPPKFEIDPLIADLLPAFVLGAQAEVNKGLQALDDGTFDVARRAAHNIKGTAGTYGLHALGELAADIEGAAKRGERTAVVDGLERLRGQLAIVERRLNDEGVTET